MKYPSHRFYESSTQFKESDGSITPAKVYTYESTKALYDIVVINGFQYARTNCGALGLDQSTWDNVHHAIKAHFGLPR